MSESGWVTQREAARLLGVHPSAVPKMVRRGELAPRDEVPSMSRAQVLELAAVRAAAAAEVGARRTTTRSEPQPPDDVHEWLQAPTAAAVLGCAEVALFGRATRGKVSYAVHDRRRWFRLDLLELLVRAEVAGRRRRP